MDSIRLGDSEYQFAKLVWEHEPISSGDLVSLCLEHFGWKKSTTYTVLKKLCEKGIFQNTNTIVSSCISKDVIEQQVSEAFIKRTFQNSLPSFLNAFMNHKQLSDQEADELKALIDQYRKDDK